MSYIKWSGKSLTPVSYFKIPLNLPHAATLAQRIAIALEGRIDWIAPESRALSDRVRGLQELLLPFRLEGENPPAAVAESKRQEAAVLLRGIVEEVEKKGLGGDSLGLCVRNLFECLEMGEEGSKLSLRAGENPDSAQRPL